MCNCYLCIYSGEIADIDLNKVKEIDINIQHNEDKFIEFIEYHSSFVINWIKEILDIPIVPKHLINVKLIDWDEDGYDYEYKDYYFETNIDAEYAYIFVFKYEKLSTLLMNSDYKKEINSFNDLANFLKFHCSYFSDRDTILSSKNIDEINLDIEKIIL